MPDQPTRHPASKGQTRAFCFVDDPIDGFLMMMNTDVGFDEGPDKTIAYFERLLLRNVRAA